MNLNTSIAVVLAAVILAVGLSMSGGDTNVTDGQGGVGVPGIAMYPQVSLNNTITWAPVATTSAYTLSHAESGSTVLLSASGTSITLPAARDEVSYKFVVNGALDSANVVIASAEGDNIEGTLIVAGAVVDCAAEDQINFVTDGENVGDYVELYSDGTSWLIGDSGVLTSAKMTCTDPS